MDGPDGRSLMEHADAALSALLDGELEGLAADWVHAHVERCPSCAEELRGVRSSRQAVRSLPGLDPPPGFIETAIAAVTGAEPLQRVVSLDVHRRRRTAFAANVAASVAASVALLVVGSGWLDATSLAPELGGAVEDHAATASALAIVGTMEADGGPDPLAPDRPVTPSTEPPRASDGLPAPFRAPAMVGDGYRLVQAFTHQGGLQVVYAKGRYALSVFETVGQVDFEALPAGGSRIDIGGAHGWRLDSPDVAGRIVVLELDGLAVTVAGDEGGDAVLEAARSLPGPRSLSMLQRLRQACDDTLEGLSLAG